MQSDDLDYCEYCAGHDEHEQCSNSNLVDAVRGLLRRVAVIEKNLRIDCKGGLDYDNTLNWDDDFHNLPPCNPLCLRHARLEIEHYKTCKTESCRERNVTAN